MTQQPDLSPTAPRNFKAIRIPFNEYEYERLELLARLTGRTKLNVIRWAILEAARVENRKAARRVV